MQMKTVIISMNCEIAGKKTPTLYYLILTGIIDNFNFINPDNTKLFLSVINIGNRSLSKAQ